MNVRAIFATLSLLMLAVVAAPAAAGAADASPAGVWQIAIETPDGGALNVELTLKQDGDELTGVLVGDDAVETEISDAEFEDGQLSFKISRDFSGQELKSTFQGKLDGDKFAGTVDFELGSESGTLTATGTRAAAASVAGAWKLSIETPDGNTLAPVLMLTQEGETVTGTFTGDDGNEVEIEDGSFKDGELAFSYTADFGGQSLITKFKLEVEGDKLAGAVEYDLSGQTGELDVTGARPEMNLNGTWLLVATSDAGVFEPKLHLKHDGDDISGNYEWTESVVAEVQDGEIVGGELIFTVTHDFDGQEIVVKFKVKQDGEKLAGLAEYDLGGQTGTAEIEGSRSKAADIAGDWNIAITGENGDTIEVTAKLTQDGDKIGGDYTGPAGDAKVSDAKLDGKTLTFKVVRERDGQELILNYKGEVDGDTITGDVEFDFDGQTRSTTFEAKRS